ncbi:MAG: excinuclease ABC subunit UvrC [Hyphomicrobiaceae bacterium]
MPIETPTDAPHGDEPENAGIPKPTGPDVVASYLKTLPGSPGVYRMLDIDGNVIYVGKARSLKARVSNYARLGGHTQRIARMIASTASMEFVTVRTEAEALLLEANLIKRFRPRFNVLLRDDKSFPFILIARDHEAPQIMKHRGARNRKGNYYGPFASAGAVGRTINMLQRAFLLRTCSDSVYESRTRPCLLYQIKRCSAPCTGEIGLEDYGKLVDEATRFLKGESQSVRRMYQQLMEQAADKLEFERAASYRNRLWALAHVQADQSINTDGVEEADIFAAHQEGGQTCVQVFFFRSGQNWGNRAYYPKADRSLDAAEVLESFIAQFYDDKPVPRLILASHDFPTRELMEEALSTKAERRVEIRVPRRGAKSGLVEHALQNAREALGRRLAESSSQRILLAGMADRLGLMHAPRRIEVFDNSHISGSHAVGAMIVAGVDGLVKNQFRKFNIKSADLAPGDDYGMMREVLTRRFKRLVGTSNGEEGVEEPETEGVTDAPGSAERSRIIAPEPLPLAERGANAIAFGVLRADGPSGAAGECQTGAGALQPAAGEELALDEPVEEDDDGEFPQKPDLVLIDGGAGQLRIACEVLADLGISDVAVAGVAKGPDRDAGREHFHVPGRDVFMLEPRDPVLYFIQRLRDEAHRFAIGTHRAKRSKAISANPLDEIAGIGSKRKRALMNHFGSAKAVSRAGVEDLKAVSGISAEMAQKIYDFFHERRG